MGVTTLPRMGAGFEIVELLTFDLRLLTASGQYTTAASMSLLSPFFHTAY
jgi:hypothetical protein